MNPAGGSRRRDWWLRPLTLWVVTRVVLMTAYWALEVEIHGDVNYYDRHLGGGQASMPEYPLPAYWLLMLPWQITRLFDSHVGRQHGFDSFQVVWPLVMLALDFAFLILLRRQRPADATRDRPTVPESVWIFGVLALGPVAYARFDLVTGVLVAAALLHSARRPVMAGGAAAIAVAVKYWPIVTLPALAAPLRTRWRVILGAATVGGLILIAALAVGGWDRIMSPLHHQSDRGLQIEAVAATPAMLPWAAGSSSWKVSLISNAWEVSGPFSSFLMSLSTVMTVVVLAGLAVLWLRAWRLQDTSTDVALWLTITAASAWIAVSKVLSPQYLLWVLPAVAVGFLITRNESSRRHLVRFTVILGATCVLTQLEFPIGYSALRGYNDFSPLVVAILAMRNLTLIGLACYGAYVSWQLTRRPASV